MNQLLFADPMEKSILNLWVWRFWGICVACWAFDLVGLDV